MGSFDKSRAENVAGNFFVDSTCIDCNTCRWMAPEVFARVGDQSAVTQQPEGDGEILRTAQALVACPTASIGMLEKSPLLKEAVHSFPHPIRENVYHCGYHIENSFGAASYFISSDYGNMLIDSPRFAAPLVRNIEKLGGIKTMLLTHIDDVGDHEKFQKHFGCERLIHRGDLGKLEGIEIVLEAKEPVQLNPDLKIIPVPGHTEGSIVFLYQDRFLFSGDHLAFSNSLRHFHAFKGACWYSWDELKHSMRRLASFPFQFLLPGHGNSWSGSFEEAAEQMEKCLQWMEQT
ncbi:MBL fold metallo-hydrolase [bacterium]|jgi:glyoxylase-like metal-dependent hydrolase (beta-lactamase superfamily II)/ferredoxin|nr:MBL fold metallo-hydrolase [bacterium]